MKRIICAALAFGLMVTAGDARAENIVLFCKSNETGYGHNIDVNDQRIIVEKKIFSPFKPIEFDSNHIIFSYLSTPAERMSNKLPEVVEYMINRSTGDLVVRCIDQKTQLRDLCPPSWEGTCQKAEPATKKF